MNRYVFNPISGQLDTISVPDPGTRFVFVAGAALSAHRVVILDDGELRYAQPTPADVRGPLLLTLVAMTSGEGAEVLVCGMEEDVSLDFAPGTTLFLGTNGTLSPAPSSSGAVVRVARAVEQHAIYFDPSVAIALAA